MTVPAETFPVLPDDAGPSDLQRWRDDYRRRRARRSSAIAGVEHGRCSSSVVGTAIVLSPGWPRTRESFLNWEIAQGLAAGHPATGCG